MDKCPKCHDTAIHFQQTQSSTAVTTTARFCGCPTAKLFLARLQAQAIPKGRASLIARDILERLVQLAARKAKP